MLCNYNNQPGEIYRVLAERIKAFGKLSYFRLLRMITVALFLFVFLICLGNSYVLTGDTESLNGWSSRVRLMIDHNMIDSNLNDFPVLLYISADSGKNSYDLSGIFEEIGSNSRKIAVTTADGTTQCYVEIEKWDSVNEQAWLWVKLPVISSSSDTILFLYYDNNQPDNTTYVGYPGSIPGRNVWDSNFNGVWHKDDGPGNTIVDSTNFDNILDKQSADQPIEVDGIISKAQDYNGNYAYAAAKGNLNDITGQLTISGWYKPDGSNPGFIYILSKNTATTGNMQYGLLIRNPASGGQWGAYLNGTERVLGDRSWAAGQWYYITITWDGSTLRGYVNGELEGSIAHSGMTAQGDYINIGRRSNSVDGTTSSGQFYGALDEVRLSSIARSAAWTKAEYYSGTDNLISWSNYYFRITGGFSTTTAGVPQEITITARDSLGNINSDYNGNKSLIFSGAEIAPNGVHPTASDNNDNDINFGIATPVTFINGVGTCTVKLYKAEEQSIRIDVTDGVITSINNPNHGLGTSVVPAPKDKLLWVKQPSSPVVAGEAWPGFSIEITDEYNNRTFDHDEITVIASSGTLNGNVTRTAFSGLAIFYGISYDDVDAITVTGSASGVTSTPPSDEIEVMVPWLSGWSYRKKISVDHTYIDETLTDFPLWVRLDEDAEIGAAARSDGYDIRFTLEDNHTILKYERETWSGGGGVDVSADIWVKIPTVYSSEDTYIYMYYGKADAEDGEDATAVWNSNFLSVWHKNDGNGTLLADSTENGHSGTKKAVNEPSETGGVIGRAQYYDGNDYVVVDKSASVRGLSEVTFTAWINPDGWLGVNNRWYHESNSNQGLQSRISLSVNTNGTLHLGFRERDSDSFVSYDGNNTVNNPGEWTFVSYVIDMTNNQIRFYIDAELDRTFSRTMTSFSDTEPMLLEMGRYEPQSLYYRGVVDEIRVSSTARSAAWIKAEYYTAMRNLQTAGEEEVPPPDTPVNISPADEIVVEGLTPTLAASNYFHPIGISHAASQWQITTFAGDYSAPIYDSGHDVTSLTSIDVPADTFSGATIYYWRVRYQDEEGVWSRYSAETAFMTEGVFVSTRPGMVNFGYMHRREHKEMEGDDLAVNVVSPAHDYNIYFYGTDLEDKHNEGNYIPVGNMDYRLEGGEWTVLPDIMLPGHISDMPPTGFGYYGENHLFNFRLSIPPDTILSEYRGTIVFNVTTL